MVIGVPILTSKAMATGMPSSFGAGAGARLSSWTIHGLTKMKLIKKFKGMKISFPLDWVNAIRKCIPTWEQEAFFVAFLNSKNEVIVVMTSLGTVNNCTVTPRDVYREAIRQNATSVIVAHNHPSGNIEASTEDEGCTRRLVSVGKEIGIKCLDHIIITKHDYFSMRESSAYINIFA